MLVILNALLSCISWSDVSSRKIKTRNHQNRPRGLDLPEVITHTDLPARLDPGKTHPLLFPRLRTNFQAPLTHTRLRVCIQITLLLMFCTRVKLSLWPGTSSGARSNCWQNNELKGFQDVHFQTHNWAAVVWCSHVALLCSACRGNVNPAEILWTSTPSMHSYHLSSFHALKLLWLTLNTTFVPWPFIRGVI